MPKFKLISKVLFAIFFVLAGLNHFFSPAFYLHIMPPYLPWQRLLVYLSGVWEIILGTLLLIPNFTRLAAWGLVVLLIAVLPANIHMAVHHDLYPEYSAAILWMRLPLQFLLMGCAYWYTLSVASGKKRDETAAA